MDDIPNAQTNTDLFNILRVATTIVLLRFTLVHLAFRGFESLSQLAQLLAIPPNKFRDFSVNFLFTIVQDLR